MKSIARKSLAGLMLLAALAVTIGLTAQDQEPNKKHARYSVKTLGTLGGTSSDAARINNKSWVTGYASLTGDTVVHASLWRNGVITDLGTLGGVNSNVFWPLKNDRGLIAGFAQTSTVDPLGETACTFGVPDSHQTCLGFLWEHGVMTPLATLGGNNSGATGVNNRGQIVGAAENSTHDPSCISPQVLDYEAVIWGPKKGDIRELPAFSGDSVAAAFAINDSGQVVGESGSCGSGLGISPIYIHAVLWQNGSVTDLGNLGGVMNNVANAINDRGQVVGGSDLPGDTTGHAFLWTKHNGIQDLGTLPGDFSSFANGINNEGQVVGQSCDISGNCRAFLWQNGVMTDINTLITAGSSLYLVSGNDINDEGDIVGQAFDQSSGDLPGFLATPCNGDRNDKGGCGDDAEGTTAAGVANSEGPNITLPEYVRNVLNQRRGFGRVER
jgi:probable HAF family extracellular repeat protein